MLDYATLAAAVAEVLADDQTPAGDDVGLTLDEWVIALNAARHGDRVWGRKTASDFVRDGLKSGQIRRGIRQAVSPMDGRRFRQNVYCLVEPKK
jgi:hypothetical protein